MSWIRFDELAPSESGKTRVWAVNVADAEEVSLELGRVKWFVRWRKYAFFPNANMVFEQDCLREIADFCADRTTAHKSR